MSAETLRKAAALMRKRAEAATAGPWIVAEQTHSEWYGLQSQWTAMGNLFGRTEADHIASWHPAVALAVADWLDEEADTWEHDPSDEVGLDYFRAYQVAAAYLGES